MSNTIISECIHHGLTEFSLEKRYDRSEKSYNKKCKKCTNKRRRERHNKKKKQCIEYKGNKCQICKNKYNTYQYDFHHLNPTEKKFEIKNELDKCLLVCSSCHLKIHGGDCNINPKYQIKKYMKCKKHNQNRCIECHYSDNRSRENFRLTTKLIEFSGGKCSRCNENSFSCLSFHHIDATIKLFSISKGIAKRFPTYLIMTEIEKCSLLCENCHREEHHGKEVKINLKKIKLQNKQKEYIHNNFFGGKLIVKNSYNKNVNKKIYKKCIICSNTCKTNRRNYCSDKCLYFAGFKDIKLKKLKKNKLPIIYDIINFNIKNNYNHLKTARYFKISDASIHTRIKVLSKLTLPKKDQGQSSKQILIDHIKSNFKTDQTLKKHKLSDEFYLYVHLAKAIREIKKNKETKDYYISNILN